jgi:hypothetical protein
LNQVPLSLNIPNKQISRPCHFNSNRFETGHGVSQEEEEKCVVPWKIWDYCLALWATGKPKTRVWQKTRVQRKIDRLVLSCNSRGSLGFLLGLAGSSSYLTLLLFVDPVPALELKKRRIAKLQVNLHHCTEPYQLTTSYLTLH